jgi:hypothetical protein
MFSPQLHVALRYASDDRPPREPRRRPVTRRRPAIDVVREQFARLRHPARRARVAARVSPRRAPEAPRYPAA